MTGTTQLLPCPDCHAPLTGAPTCAACGLRLTGPDAVRLWEVDQALAGLEVRRGELMTERGGLLLRLRPGAGPATQQTAATSVRSSPGAAVWSAPGTTWQPSVAGKPAQEWTPQRVQNTLLGLGALLLTVAGIVFAAVTYDRLGAAGRATVLLTLTAAAGFAVPVLKRRGLDATAETVGVVTLALALLDAYGLRTLGLADGSSGLAYAAGTCAAVAVACGLYAAAVPIRLPRFAAVGFAQLPVLLLLADAQASLGVAGLALALLAAADLAVAVVVHHQLTGPVRTDLRSTAAVCAGSAAALAVLAAATGAAADEGRAAAAVALLVLAGLAVATGLLVTGTHRLLALALPAPLVAGAAVALAVDAMTTRQLPLVVAAVALAAVLAAAQLPRAWRDGPVAGAVATTAAALVTQAEAITQAVVLPFTWLDDPWTLAAGATARAALSPLAPSEPWPGSVVTLVVVTAAAVTVAAAGLALHRIRASAPVVAGLITVAAVVLPLGLDLSYSLAVVLLLALTVALLTAGTVVARTDVALACLGAGSAVALLTAGWALADRDATLIVLPVLAVTLAGVATRWAAASAAAGVTAGAALAAAGAARGLHTDQIGVLLLIVPAVLVALTFVLADRMRLPLEVAAAVLTTTSLLLTATDPGWLSWAFAAAGLLALADALHPDRRVVAAAGALLLSASSWVRLAEAGVESPEPYVVPLAVVALVLGHLRRRRDLGIRSYPAYGAGLSLLLLPSLVASLDDTTLTRPLLLGAVALVVLLVGAAQRLQAPLAIGAGVLAVDALHLLAPYASALPRWLTLGAVGLLLVGIGATYEQRRRDLARVRRSYEALA